MKIFLISGWMLFGIVVLIEFASWKLSKKVSKILASLSLVFFSTFIAESSTIAKTKSNHQKIFLSESDPWNVNEQITIAPAIEENEDIYVVVRGDNLWAIAEKFVINESSTGQVWQKIISKNIATLKSGNPNLIFPGEVLKI